MKLIWLLSYNFVRITYVLFFNYTQNSLLIFIKKNNIKNNFPQIKIFTIKRSNLVQEFPFVSFPRHFFFPHAKPSITHKNQTRTKHKTTFTQTIKMISIPLRP